MGRALGGQRDGHRGGAAPGDQVAGQGGELALLRFGADGGTEVGVLVDDE